MLGTNGPQVVLAVLAQAEGNSQATRVQPEATQVELNAFLSIDSSETWFRAFRGRWIALEIEILRLNKEQLLAVNSVL